MIYTLEELRDIIAPMENPHYAAALRFQAAWLDVLPERLCEDKSFVNPTKIRGECVPGYAKPFQVYALHMEGSEAIFAACVPALEAKLRRRDIFRETKPTSACLYFSSLNPAIDFSRAKALEESDIEAFVQFHREAYPACKNHDWIPDFARESIAGERLFGVFEGGRLVSVADAPTTPYLPEAIVEPGIFTLQEHRRKGYAAIVCAALIDAQLRRGLTPYWSCAAENAASIKLAKHLGFKMLGELWKLERI